MQVSLTSMAIGTDSLFNRQGEAVEERKVTRKNYREVFFKSDKNGHLENLDWKKKTRA